VRIALKAEAHRRKVKYEPSAEVIERISTGGSRRPLR
jgi:hypothetical protein